MIRSGAPDPPPGSEDTLRAGEQNAAEPQGFSGVPPGDASTHSYFADHSIRKLVEFFATKGIAALKDEDRRELWYADWLAYQAKHRLYASVLTSKAHSDPPAEFDLLRFARFLEVFAYCSPAHAYSLQVSYLAIFSIWMGSNTALKRQAVAALEAGGVLAFGVSERDHGSDLLGNEFALRHDGDGRYSATGRKYYIGNVNVASVIAVLANRQDGHAGGAGARARRALPVLYALRLNGSAGVPGARKIRTLGIRAAFVGEFELVDHEVSADDVVGEGRDAWDAVFGAVTLGRYFLGFGSVGICEHAMQEATTHLVGRVLYRQPVIELPHIRSAMARAYARLTAMKLYAYRALDYVHAAADNDRRYLLFTAVQKAKVSTDGVKVMALISECVGAKGFEADTYIEMALRDIQLIPGLEGSTHLNLKLAAQFIDNYFEGAGTLVPAPKSLGAGEAAPHENAYLMAARTGATYTIQFPGFRNAYRPLRSLPNVRLFVCQAAAFRRCIRRGDLWRRGCRADLEITLLVGQCQAVIAYAQLIAEAASIFRTPAPLVAVIFDLLVGDFSAAALALASLPQMSAADRVMLRRVVAVPQTTAAEWKFVARRLLDAYRAS